MNYYLEVADAALNHLRNRPTVLKRFVNGAGEEPFFQKRVPDTAPEWIETAMVSFPSGRTARELLPNDAAHLIWGVNLGVIDWNPWPVRAPDLDHPDELRVDLDPTPEASFDDVRRVALCAGEVLREHGLTGFPKTSGSRGIHINVRIEPEHDFTVVRRAALALAREVERRMPEDARPASGGRRSATGCSSTTTRTRATARWPPPTACGRRPTRACRRRSTGTRSRTSSPRSCGSTPSRPRLRAQGRPERDDRRPRGLAGGPARAGRARRGGTGLGDGAWPPQFPKQPGEPKRVQPSRAKPE